MDDQQRWIFIEDLFEQMMETCDSILRLLENPTMPISPDEAKRLLEDAKDYLTTGG